jgi:hypothetical protein
VSAGCATLVIADSAEDCVGSERYQAYSKPLSVAFAVNSWIPLFYLDRLVVRVDGVDAAFK